MGVKKVKVVANKVRDEEDEKFIAENVMDDLLGFIHYNSEVIDADRKGKSPFDFSDKAIEEVKQIKNIIDADLIDAKKN